MQRTLTSVDTKRVKNSDMRLGNISLNEEEDAEEEVEGEERDAEEYNEEGEGEEEEI